MNRLSLWRAYVEGTPLAKTIPEARRGELFLDNGSFSEVLLNKLMGTRHATIIPNDFFINHINLQHAPEITDVNYPASEKLGLIARSALYQERHLLEDWPTFSDEDVANLIRHGRLPSAILLRGELDPSFQDVETQDVVVLRQATRRHRFGQQVVAEFMGVSQESLGSTLPVDANDVADLLDIYALSIAAHDRGQSLLDMEDMFGQVSSTSVFNEAAHIFLKHDGDRCAFNMVSTGLWFRSLVVGEIDNRIFDLNEMATSTRFPELSANRYPTAIYNFSSTDGMDRTFAEFRDVLAYLMVKDDGDVVGVGFDEDDLRRVRDIREHIAQHDDPTVIDDAEKQNMIQALIDLDTPGKSPFTDFKKTLLAMREFINSDYFEHEVADDKNDVLKQVGSYFLMKFLHGADELARDVMQEVFSDRFRNADSVRRNLFRGLHLPQKGGGPRNHRGFGRGSIGDPEPEPT